MRQARLKRWKRFNTIDVILNNTLLPTVLMLALYAYVCEVTV
jgi:hypothetical protein